MRVIILTSSKKGTAAHHLSNLFEGSNYSIAGVVYNQGKRSSFQKTIKRKIKKTGKIGILGALNGMRMRKWYNQDIDKFLSFDDIEKSCKKYSVPFFETPEINCSRTEDLFEELDADVGLSLGNGYISKRIFEQFKYGMLNIHHEQLPGYQNAQSVIWQIYNQSKTTGFTIHQINKNIDEGDILYQEEVPIIFEETLSTTVSKTYAMLWEKSAKGLVHVLNNFEKYYSNAEPQGNGNSYTTPSFWEFLKIYMNYRKLKKEYDHGKLSQAS